MKVNKITRIEIKVDSRSLPDLLRKDGDKKLLQIIKNSQNRAINAGKKFANSYLGKNLGLPKKGPKFGPVSPFEKPSINSVLNTKLVRGIGGIEAGVPSILITPTKRISLIRFVNSSRKIIKQKGIPRRERRQNVVVKLGQRNFGLKRSFIQKGKGTTRHVFITRKSKKWKLTRRTLPSVNFLLKRITKEMESEASSKFNQVFSSFL